MAIGRQGHLTVTTLVWSALAIVPVIGVGALIGLAAHRPLLGATIAGVVAAGGQTLLLLWAIASRLRGHPQ